MLHSSKGLKHLHKEIKILRQKKVEGLTLILNESDLFNVMITITGPEGSPYEGGLFDLRMQFCDEYPIVPPKATCITKIFHPNIAPTTGEICLNTLQKDWNPNLGLERLLLTIKSLLMTPNPESALNEEAGKLLLANYDLFCQRAAMMTTVHATKSSSSLPGHAGNEPLIPESEPKIVICRPLILEEAIKKIRRV